MTRPWMTIRHCRMRLTAIEEVLSELLEQVRELKEEWDTKWIDAEEVE